MMKLLFLQLLFFTIMNNAHSQLLNVDLFEKTETCSDDCLFCHAIKSKDWKKVEHKIKSLIDQNQDFRKELLKHKNVQFVLPAGSILLSLPTWAVYNVGFKTNDSTFLFDINLQLGKVYRLGCKSIIDEKTVILQKFYQVDSTYKFWSFRDEWLSRFSDSLVFREGPKRVLPQDEYFISFYGITNEALIYPIQSMVYTNKGAAIDSLEKRNDVLGLCLMMCSYNLDTRFYALQSLNRLNDPKCLPLLIKIAFEYKDYHQQGSEIATIYDLFCAELAQILDKLTNNSFSKNENLTANQMLQSGFETWKLSFELEKLLIVPLQ